MVGMQGVAVGILEDVVSELPIDGSAELVHGPDSFHVPPQARRGWRVLRRVAGPDPLLKITCVEKRIPSSAIPEVGTEKPRLIRTVTTASGDHEPGARVRLSAIARATRPGRVRRSRGVVERGSLSGSRAGNGRRGSPCGRARRWRSAEQRVRVVEQRLQTVRVTLETRVAPERLPAGLREPRRRRGGGASTAGQSRARRVRVIERRAGRASAEHEALRERVGREAVGAMQPGAGALADGVQAGERATAPPGPWRSLPSCSAPPERPARAPARDRCPPGAAR